MLSPSSGRFASRAGVLAVTAALILGACSSGTDEPAEPDAGETSDAGTDAGTETLRFAYIQKQGDQQYFVDQANGAKQAAAEVGAEVTVVDVGDDANKAISEVDAAIAQGFDGIIIVVPDQKIGPQVIEQATNAGIPIMASDDIIMDADGNEAPFVGFDGAAMGQLVGQKAGELFKDSGWAPADTRILRVSKEDLSVCEDRVNAAEAAFTEASGEQVETIKVGTDASVIDAQDQTAAIITANPDVQKWVVYGCNDESATGAVTSLANAGFGADAVIGVGLGAYLTCKDWQSGTETGNKAALFISGTEVGIAAVTEMAKSINDGTPLPPKTIARTAMVDATNWEAEGVVCT